MDSSTKITLVFLISIFLLISTLPIEYISCSSTISHNKHKKPKTTTTHPILKPPIMTLPPPVISPPITNPNLPPPPPSNTCPIDALKLEACVDLLGGFLHIGLGDPVVNHCCPIIHGLLEVEAAVCLCTTLKLKLLNLNLYVPLALQLLLTCGKPPPPGFVCTLST